MKIWNTIIAATFAFGTSVTADPGSIRKVDEGGFTVSLAPFDVLLIFRPHSHGARPLVSAHLPRFLAR